MLTNNIPFVHQIEEPLKTLPRPLIVDVFFFYDGHIDMQIFEPLCQGQSKVSETHFVGLLFQLVCMSVDFSHFHNQNHRVTFIERPTEL